jgi:asparagine synthase (glutamine-hydrolysing)
VAAEACLPENDDPLRRRIKLLLRGFGRTLPEQYLRWTYYFAEEEKRRLLAPAAARWRGIAPSARLIAQGLEEAAQLDDVQTRIQYVDLQTFLPDNILHYTDRTSMAVSLEVRVPFLDPHVVGWSFRRPFTDKLSSGASKRILRRAFEDLIPPENLAAPKRGFCPPLAAWFRGPLDRYFDTHLTGPYVAEQGIFDWAEIQRLRLAHRRRRRDVSMELFAIIMFDVWWRRYVVGDRGAASIR